MGKDIYMRFGDVLAIRPRVTLLDGVSLSIQASWAHYCLPRTTGATQYTHVEVGFIEDAEGNLLPLVELFEDYAEYSGHWDEELDEYVQDKFDGIYAYLPVELLVQFIEQHGGFGADELLQISDGKEIDG